MLTVIKGQNVNQTLAMKALLRPSMGQSNKNLRHNIPFLSLQEKNLIEERSDREFISLRLFLENLTSVKFAQLTLLLIIVWKPFSDILAHSFN